MVCYVSCILAIAFIAASLFVTFNSEKNPALKEYINGLNEIQKKKYFEIAMERRNIYLTGFFIGFVLSLILLYFYMKKMNRWGNICMVGAITFAFSYFYYILTPKKDNMITYLDEKDDRENWWKVYNIMQKYYHLGFVLGLIGAVLFCNFIVSK